MTELWKPIRGYEGLYSVSNLGRVRSEARTTAPYLNRTRTKLITRPVRERVMRTRVDNLGYLAVDLSRDGRIERVRVHSVLMEAFTEGRPFPGAHCRHLDDNKSNNTLENLAWGTALDNAADAKRNGRLRRVTHCKHGHEFSLDNTLISGGRRFCRKCQRLNAARFRQRQREIAS